MRHPMMNLYFTIISGSCVKGVMMNLYLTKISGSYVKGVMGYQGGQPDPLSPLGSDVVPKVLVSEGLRRGSAPVKGSPVWLLCLTMNEEPGPETNRTAEYELSFKKQSRNARWPCLEWKMGYFILSKPHSY